MHVQQLYTSCLSEAAYFIASDGEAAVVDPLRDIQDYLALAKEHNVTIKYIFETHFHADFVSGHLELQKATGATIIYGPSAVTNYKIYNATHNETFTVGALSIKALHTPGHTLESTCYLLHNEAGQPHCIFTGDTLFIGDVGRPDLSQKGEELTMQDLAATLYNSLQNHIHTLPNEVIIYPAHGAGSSCGKSLSKETFSTIGEQKESNYALQPQSQAEFVTAVTQGLAAPPAYFPINAVINKKGYEQLEAVLAKALTPLSIATITQHIKDRDVILLDTRNATTFTQGFIPTSIFIGLEGRFAEWAGSLIPYTSPIVLITEIGKEKETATRLTRVGLDNIQGYLLGGYEAWVKDGQQVDMIIDVEADELAMDLPYDDNALIVDVRKETEFGNEHVEDAKNLSLAIITDPGNLAFIEDTDNLYIHCAGGYRSVIAASILKKEGFHNLRNVLGGWASISALPDKFKFVKEAAVLN